MVPDIGQLRRDEEGSASVEYALLLAVVVVAGIAAWRELGNVVGNVVEQSTATVASGGA